MVLPATLGPQPRVRFNFPPPPTTSNTITANPYESWSCYPSNQLQWIPPPPVVVLAETKPANPAKKAKTAAAGGGDKAKKKVEEGEGEKGEEGGKEKKAKAKAKPRPGKKPSLSVEGAEYVYPRKPTQVHLVRERKVWEEGAEGKGGWGFKKQMVPVGLSVKEFGEAVIGEEGWEGWTVTEMWELGDGEFAKERSIKLDDEKANGTMASFNWTERRGENRDLPPVWLVVHKD